MMLKKKENSVNSLKVYRSKRIVDQGCSRNKFHFVCNSEFERKKNCRNSEHRSRDSEKPLFGITFPTFLISTRPIKVLPIKDSHLDLKSEFHTTVDSYENEHKETVNVDAHLKFAFVKISGSYR